MSMEAVLRGLVVFCASYLCLVYASYLTLMLVGFAESRRSRREHRIEDLGALGSSRFSPSVSVVLAAYNEAVALPHAVRSLLGLDYAEFEVIVVNDGSTDDTLEKLRRTLDLAPVEESSRGLIETERIVGVTGHIAISGRPEEALAENGEPAKLDSRAFLAFQHSDYLRSFFNNRLGWTRLNTMLCAVGAFQIWRSDVLEEIGGFSTTFTCEDIELTFRVHEHFRREGKPYEIVSLADTVGVTEGPDTLRKLIAQRERWQRVILETVVAYRRMMFKRRYGAVGFVGVPFFILSEVIAPVFELLALVALAASVALGALDPEQALLTLAALALMNGLMTSAAVLLEDRTSRAYPIGDLVRLILLGPLDLVVYRPFIVWARIKGTWRYLRGDQGWHKFERNARPAT